MEALPCFIVTVVPEIGASIMTFPALPNSPATARLPRTGWSEPARANKDSEPATVRAPHPRLAQAQPAHDPIFAGSSRPAVVARKSLPEPHPRHGHETAPRHGVTTSPRPGSSLK